MAAVSTGTTCLFGVAGTVTNLFVQSYTVNSTFNLSGTVVDETGLTKTARYDDRKTEITVDGICKSSVMPIIGATFSFTINAATAYPSGTASVSYVGTITAVSEKGSNKDFVSVTVTAVDYEGITPA
tara:strand:- start:326 stop:706 length:381 start_codon:yes stop_codon:yes gene_type:complete